MQIAALRLPPADVGSDPDVRSLTSWCSHRFFPSSWQRAQHGGISHTSQGATTSTHEGSDPPSGHDRAECFLCFLCGGLFPLAQHTGVSISPTSLSFGTQPVATTSPAQTITLSNGRSAALSITGLTITGANSGDFAWIADTCGSSLAGGGNCIIAVTSASWTSRRRTTTLTITDNANGSPQTASSRGREASAQFCPGEPAVPVNQLDLRVHRLYCRRAIASGQRVRSR